MSIHPSHSREWRPTLRAVIFLAALALLLHCIPQFDLTIRLDHYLPIHTILEIIAIAAAITVFAVGWTAPQSKLPRNILLLACLFLGVAILDVFHMLSFIGMPDVITPSSAEKSIYFWLAARTMAALALLVAALLPWHVSALLPRGLVLTGTLLIVLSIFLVFTFHTHALPDVFIEGKGLTNLKIIYEFGLVFIYLLAATILFFHLRKPRSFNTSGFIAAALVTAMSETFFLSYISMSGSYNLLGHIYKVIAYAFLYHAIFVEIIKRPYQQLDTFFNASLDLFTILDTEGRIILANKEWQNLLGYPLSFIKGKTIFDFIHPDHKEAAEGRMALLNNQESILNFESCYRHKDGSFRYIEWRGIPQGSAIYTSGRDITKLKKQQETLRKLSLATNQSPFPIIITNLDAEMEYVNDAFVTSSGYSKEEALGKNPRILQSGKTPHKTYVEMWASLSQGKPWQGELINRKKDGNLYTERAMISPVRNENNIVTHYLAHKEDITEQKYNAAKIKNLSHYDQLTGLANHALLDERFRHSISLAKEHDHPLTIMWLDIDNFKAINDGLGHHVGDELLLKVAEMFNLLIRDQDTLSRQSGDEFIFLLPGMDENDAALMATRLLESLAAPIALNNNELIIKASIGIAIYPNDGDTLGSLLMKAEAAMYRVKKEGRNGYRFFTSEMQEHSSRVLILGAALHRAIAQNELFLVYQPQICLATKTLVGAEVLLRWQHPELGSISPAEFIPIAESNGLIVPIGDWVLKTALQQLRRWQQSDLPSFVVAVNLSAVQFLQQGLASNIARLVEESGITPGTLELELTEAMAMSNPEAAIITMRELHALGLLLSIDDFGTGYSSLSYLKRFAIEKLKIDQSFVRDLHNNVEDQAIVTAIIQMARGLGIRTIAEGVETAEQVEFLHQRGCDEVQGYFYARPMPANDFELFLRRFDSDHLSH